MKRTYLLLLICVLTGFIMTATQFTQEQAKHATEQFLKQKAGKAASISATKVVPVMRHSDDNDAKATVYAVNVGSNDGFVLVVGNDRSNDIIGYCDQGTFDMDNIPRNMRSWLESYIDCASKVNDVNTTRSLRAMPGLPTKTPIAALLNSKWNQNSPYNDQCPMINDTHCATGCTNTAMAQVMFYHKWPTGATTAIPGYTPTNSGGTNYPTLPALEPTTFDWSKIYPSYNNDEDGTEIARLFKYLGTASKTNYAAESGATGYDALQAIIKYFGYDASATTVWRSQRSYSEWIDMLYAELQAKRPVMFSGTSPSCAHSFVVDGYDQDDYFHVNWGWGGESDGFYKVVLMNPNEQGIGGGESDDAFSIDQVALFGVQPNTGHEATPPRLTVMRNWLLCDAQGTYTYDTPGSESSSPYFTNEGYLVFAVMHIQNFTSVTGEFELGCRLVKDDGTVTKDYPWDVSPNFTPNFGYLNQRKDMHIDPVADPSLTDGDYKMYFISKPKGASTWQIVDGSNNHYMIIHLDHAHNNLTAKAVSHEAQLSVEEVKVLTATPRVGELCELKVTVKNKGTVAFHGDLGIASNNKWLDGKGYDVEPGQTVDVNFSFKPKEAGVMTYNVQNGITVLFTNSLTVAESSQSSVSSNCNLTITHQVTNAEGTVIAAPKAKLDLTVTNNSDNNYYGAIYIYCFKYTGDDGNLETTSYIETIPAHQTVVLHCESPMLTGGERYRFSTMYIKNGQEIEQDIPDVYYTTAPYYFSYDAQGNMSYKRAMATLQPLATECAIDLSIAPLVNSVNTSANPNMIIFVSNSSPITGDNVVRRNQAENVKLVDGYPFYTPWGFKANHISYTRTPEHYCDIENNKGWSTLVLPFAATSCHATIDGVVKPLTWRTSTAGGDIILATFQYENGNNMIFTYPESSSLNSGLPYLIGVPAALNRNTSLVNAPITFSADNVDVTVTKMPITGHQYKMMGTLSSINEMKNSYVLNGEGTDFVLGTHSVNPFRAYYLPYDNSSPADQLTIGLHLDVPTSIGEIYDHQSNDLQGPYYNLNGQRVTRPSKGIYIVNGKKVIIN